MSHRKTPPPLFLPSPPPNKYAILDSFDSWIKYPFSPPQKGNLGGFFWTWEQNKEKLSPNLTSSEVRFSIGLDHRKDILPAVCCLVSQAFLVFSDCVHFVTNCNRTEGSVMRHFGFPLLQLADERTRLPGPLSQLLPVQNQIFEVRVAPTWTFFSLVPQICWKR